MVAFIVPILAASEEEEDRDALKPLHDPLRLATYTPIATADVIVFREGEYAEAVDGKTKEVIVRSTDHAEVIQKAIDYVANQGGGTILIKKGVYEIASYLIPRDNITIAGEGAATILKPVPPAPYRILFGTANNIVLRDFTIDGNKANIPEWTGNRWDYHAIEIRDSSRITIENVYIHDVKAGAGIVISACENIIVDNVTITDNGEADILADAMYIGRSKYVVILSFRADNVTDSGIALDNNQHVTIVGAVISNAGQAGITWYNASSEAQQPKYLTVVGAHLINCSRALWVAGVPPPGEVVKLIGCHIIGKGVLLDYGSKIEFVDCYFNVPGGLGIDAWNANKVRISGCTFEDCSLAFRLKGEAENCFSWDVEDCRFYSADVLFEIGSDIRIRNCFFTNPGGRCIAFWNVTRGRVIGCYFQDADEGIYFGVGNSDFEVYDNAFYNITTPIYNPIGVIKRNIGYPTENSGVATIPAGSTRVTVSHGLVKAPRIILLTPAGNAKVWYENVTDTSFDIVTDTAPSADLNIVWYAEV